ncbi:sigma-70 family RNA polymerase sigma factor [Zunongwangia sp. HGR-M22]|uniref:sigma-70 family RNA polymerase sigma factor n=1 Tax=Zunongwangia sp. HGR-M22 TaxID=3015168 RepID=UPI0022DE8741|nr:sigma-70 family RNA polymerase sigma factor [Zunongwangia sp. HGR-M22]WBL24586.1 sigma-70 family RNA polymerase sigma factor [Zunongwangia sp. HGR-M22]
MNTREIWEKYHIEFYFFILKRVKNEEHTNDILQNSFIKIHKNLDKLKNPGKLKSWIFQIIRNEINDYFKDSVYCVRDIRFQNSEEDSSPFTQVCCFDKFLNELPEKNRRLMKLVYVDGKPQKEAAELASLSLANAKALIRRSKKIMKNRFKECCKYETNTEGKLVGQSQCSLCD